MLSAAGLALTLLAGSASHPPEQAAGTALMQCVAHAAGMGRISAEHADDLAKNGLVFTREPPPPLRSMAVTPYGTASFARSLSSEGDVWAVGYDSGTCMVMALGTAPEPIEERLTAMFSVPKTWRRETIKQTDPGARWSQYGWTANGRRLTAQMKVQPMPSTPVKGLVMVTIAPK